MDKILRYLQIGINQNHLVIIRFLKDVQEMRSVVRFRVRAIQLLEQTEQ
jgi:hypothetical protein